VGTTCWLPTFGDDESKTLADYADAVVEAVGDKQNLVVVGHSFGAFTAPLVADRLPVDVLVLLAGMIPSPGESPTSGGPTPAARARWRSRPSAMAV